MKKYTLSLLLVCFSQILFSQTNLVCTNIYAEQVMKGNYNPLNFLPPIIINNPDSILSIITKEISPDSLHANLDVLASFYTRNTGSDTLSDSTGIGAARRWAFQKFTSISANNNNRLIASYLQFDTTICGSPQHRNIFAVLPGADTTDKSVVIVEAHIDSRCKVSCDVTCLAQGIEDNASGTALVLELARVMSKCVFNRTVIFLLNIGEEQGLYGANAFSLYAQQQSIQIHAVLNDDIVGGVICGNTSSPPSCPGYADIDSINVRLFSSGGFNSPHKQFARFVKLEYKEEIFPFVSVPTVIQIMSAEDRTGRGGDHIPFREKSFTAIRMTSANENGNANTSSVSYHDRQHTSEDVLGLNTDLDPEIDSFFVDFNYLLRNSIINATGISMAAIGPLTPGLIVTLINDTTVAVTITQQTHYNQYRIGVRSVTNDWDSVYTFSNSLSDTIVLQDPSSGIYSVASVDSNGIESLFSEEVLVGFVGIKYLDQTVNGIKLLPNTPNPADEQTIINIISDKNVKNKSAYISIRDMNGNELSKIPVEIHRGVNEVLYNHGFHASGIFTCTLYVNGEKNNSMKMVFKD